MKKLITIFLSLIMAFSLFACDEGNDSDTLTYKASYFDSVLTLTVNGDTITATTSSEYTEDRVNVSLSLALVGGKATLSDGKLSADFSENITYEVSLDLAGDAEHVADYIEETKEFLLESAKTETDKKLVNDLFDGKTIRFGKDSALISITESCFVSLNATLNESTGIALINESVYQSGEKWVFEYYDNGAPKSRSYYNSNGVIDYTETFENDETDSDGGARPANTDDVTDDGYDPDNTPAEDQTYDISFDDSFYPNPDTTDDTVDVIPPDADLDIPILGGDDDDTKYEIDLSDGVMFYIKGTFSGKYSGMDSILDFPSDKQPIFTINVTMNEGNAVIKQTIMVKNGKLIYHNGVLAIIDFTVDEIKYVMQMEITGSGAAAYKEEMLSDMNNSDMSDTDKQLYKDALDGKEITFGKESAIYQGIKLPTIKFKLDTKTLTFESERFETDENSSSGKIEISSPVVDDLLDPNIGANTNDKQHDNNSSLSGETTAKEEASTDKSEAEAENRQ